ncbi:MAG: hypothetical protein K2P87_05215 [Lachnospiraceae bacterium]|nr:hypothetical protein [Lachnospiraceae bacterium]
MDGRILGKCGFYCGCCATYIKGGCKGCEEHRTGDWLLWKKESSKNR